MTFQPLAGLMDSEHLVFTGRDPQHIGEPTDLSESGRAEWVPLASVPELISAGQIWGAETLVALRRLLTIDDSADPR